MGIKGRLNGCMATLRAATSHFGRAEPRGPARPAATPRTARHGISSATCLHFLHDLHGQIRSDHQRTRTGAMTSAFALPRGLRRAAAAATTAAVWALAVAPAAADDLIVKYDQSQLLRLPRPAAEIIIGNPAIADVAVQSGNLLVVTGKSFGITNIIALDADRNVIQDQRVLVRRDDAKVVNLQRGTDRQSYNC